jgi:hypothetical protein
MVHESEEAFMKSKRVRRSKSKDYMKRFWFSEGVKAHEVEA